jgi:hypothetical protein
MIRRRAPLALLVASLFPIAPAAAADDCAFAAPVCATRGAVFRIAAFDPVASAVRIGPRTLVTARHAVADAKTVEVEIAEGRKIAATPVPSDYGGDVQLLDAPDLPEGPNLVPTSDATTRAGEIFSIGVDVGRRAVRVYPPGKVVFPPAAGHPLARIHHDAHSQPGNSGGALVDAKGRLVGIIASGGEGRFEAIPAAALAQLSAASGPDRAATSAEIGAAIRICTLNLEGLRSNREHRLANDKAQAIETSCRRSRNRQLSDLAAQALGMRGHALQSIKLFERALAEDPNAANSRIGLVISLVIAGRNEDAVGHIRWLLDHGVDDLQVLRLGIQAGVWGGDRALAERALARLKQINPQMAPTAERFLANPPPRPKPRQAQ